MSAVGVLRVGTDLDLTMADQIKALESQFAESTSRMQAQINSLNSKLAEMETHLGQNVPKEMNHARESMAAGSELLGVGLPRSVRAFLASIEGVGMIMSAAFAPLAIALLFEWIGKIADKVEEWNMKAELSRRSWIEIEDQVTSTTIKILEDIDKQKAKFVELTQGPVRALEYEFKTMRSTAIGAFADVQAYMSKVIAEFEKKKGWFSVEGWKNREAAEEFKSMLASMDSDMMKSMQLNEVLQAKGVKMTAEDMARPVTAQLDRARGIFQRIKEEYDEFAGGLSDRPGPGAKVDTGQSAMYQQRLEAIQAIIHVLELQQKAQIEAFNTKQEEVKIAAADRYIGILQAVYSQQDKNELKEAENQRRILEAATVGAHNRADTLISIQMAYDDKVYGINVAALERRMSLLTLDRAKNEKELRTRNEQFIGLEEDYAAGVIAVNKALADRRVQLLADMHAAMAPYQKAEEEQTQEFFAQQVKAAEGAAHSLAAMAALGTKISDQTAYNKAVMLGTDAMRSFNEQIAMREFRFNHLGLSEAQYGEVAKNIHKQIFQLEDQKAVAEAIHAEQRSQDLQREINLLKQQQSAMLAAGASESAMLGALNTLEDKRVAALNAELLATHRLSDGVQAFLLEYQHDAQITGAKIKNWMKQTTDSMTMGLSKFIVEGQADWRQLGATALEEILNMGIQWVVSHTLMQAIEAAFTAFHIGQKSAIQATDKAFGIEQAAENFNAATSFAFLAAAQALAEAPWPDNFVAAEEALGVGLGYAAGTAVGFFERGGIIPKTGAHFLHKDEGVLPAPLTSLLMNVATQPQARQSGGGGDNYAFSVHAIDSENFASYLKRNRATAVKTFKSAVRDGVKLR